MFNLNNRSKNTRTNTERASEFEFVRTLSFVGLGASGSYILGNSSDNSVVSSPNVTIIKNTNPQIVYFNFSKIMDRSIDPITGVVEFIDSPENIKYINASQKNADLFFSNFSAGNTFTVTNSEHDFGERDFNSNYTFLSLKDSLVVATCSPGLTNASEGVYNAISFDSTPVFTLSSTKVIYTDPNKFLLTNRIPCVTNSFLSSGLKTNDVLEIFNEKYKIEKISVKANGNEEILLVGVDQTTAVTIPALQLSTTNTINVYKQKNSGTSTTSTTVATTVSTTSTSSNTMYM